MQKSASETSYEARIGKATSPVARRLFSESVRDEQRDSTFDKAYLGLIGRAGVSKEALKTERGTKVSQTPRSRGLSRARKSKSYG